MSLLRISAGLVCIGFLVGTMVPILILLLPWRVRRIHVTNMFGRWIGRSILYCSGCRIDLEGLQHVREDRPAIYMTNHTSIFDAFTTIWLTPKGTVGVAKKEVFFYPFYGQAWWLAGHVFLDRGKTEKAKRSIRKAADFVRAKGLSMCILPEGTRSSDGRLRPFKKGIVHVAIATGLPIVPMVTIGAQRTWERSTLTLNPTRFTIRFLPPISTEGWTIEGMDAHIAALRRPFLETLPPDQLPE